MSSSPPAHSPQYFQISFTTLSNPTAIQVESASMGEHRADALYGPGGYEQIALTLESQELSIKNTISEVMARSELEAMERYVVRCSVMISNSKSQSENTKDRQGMPSIRL